MAKKTGLSERVSKIRLLFCDDNNQKFADAIGASKQQASSFCTGAKPVGPKYINGILNAFPQIREAWLLCGDGDMLDIPNDESSPEQQKTSDNNQSSYLGEISRLLTLLENKDKQIDRLISLLEETKKATPRKDECNEDSKLG